MHCTYNKRSSRLACSADAATAARATHGTRDSDSVVVVVASRPTDGRNRTFWANVARSIAFIINAHGGMFFQMQLLLPPLHARRKGHQMQMQGARATSPSDAEHAAQHIYSRFAIHRIGLELASVPDGGGGGWEQSLWRTCGETLNGVRKTMRAHRRDIIRPHTHTQT